MQTTPANDTTPALATTVTDIGDGVTLVKRGSCEVRVSANSRTAWGASATASGCALGFFCGKTYKSRAGAVKAASKWLAGSAS